MSNLTFYSKGASLAEGLWGEFYSPLYKPRPLLSTLPTAMGYFFSWKSLIIVIPNRKHGLISTTFHPSSFIPHRFADSSKHTEINWNDYNSLTSDFNRVSKLKSVSLLLTFPVHNVPSSHIPSSSLIACQTIAKSLNIRPMYQGNYRSIFN
jgi:hypothetical protein